MNTKLRVVLCIGIAAATFAGLASIGRAQVPEVVVSPAMSEGFCLGWANAVEAEQKRYANWKSLVVGNSTPTTAFGIALRAVADSIPPLVLLPEVTGKFSLPDGRTFDCTPKPAAPAESPK